MLLSAITTARRPARVILNSLPAPRQGNDRAVDRAAVLEAVREDRDLPERTVDIIVDKLLKELSW